MARKGIRLADVGSPNLFRETFPYTEFPRVGFDHKTVPIEIPPSVWITDTTFRDGQQSRPPFTPEQILRVFDLLHEIDGDTGLIRQCEFFLYAPRDRKAIELCQARGYRYPGITGWIRAVPSDFKLIRQMGLKETGILVSASDYHIFLKLLKTRSQALASYLDIVKAALDNGVIPRCHLEDITRADYDGFVLPFVDHLMRLGQQYGSPVKIRLCDTLGFGVPWPEATLPRSVPRLVHGLREIGVPCEQMEWHGHNDLHKGQVNATAAWLYGCSAVNTALFGSGERTGNTPLEAMVIEHAQIKGHTPGVRYSAITELADYARKELGYEIPANFPLVGRDFNVTRAGIHADGLLKDEEIYNCFDTQRLLNRAVGVVITDKTGAAGIKHWIESRYEIQIAKQDPRVIRIKDRIDAEYAVDRISGISDQEMVRWVQEAFGGQLPPARG